MTNRGTLQTIEVGTTIAGKYRIERCLGRGGMGVVLAVKHLELHEPFAIKLMQGREFANPRAVERFLREARAAVRLRSKTAHVVQVYDVGRIDSGEPYIVMELLHGQDLSDLVAHRDGLPVIDACKYVWQACDALHAAHQLGIIHRDLKPANLFLTRDAKGSPFIKVLDFGISKHVVSGDDSTDVEITGTQDVMGSPLYMSPELAKAARNASPQSDIWALGAILYKLLTGRTPFLAPSPAELFASLLAPEPVPKPTIFRPEIPRALEASILRCLDKNPALRYPTVAALQGDLAPWTTNTESSQDDGVACTVLMPSIQAKPQTSLGTQPIVLPEHTNSADSGAKNVGGDPLPSIQTRSRSMRRPSFVDALPEGFGLQPPPTPPPMMSRPPVQLTTPHVQPAVKRETSQSATFAPMHPTVPGAHPTSSALTRMSSRDEKSVSRQTPNQSEATGSTWGATQSRMHRPTKASLRVLIGLAGLVIVGMLVMLWGLVREASLPPPTSASVSSAAASVRLAEPSVSTVEQAPKLRETETIPVGSVVSKPMSPVVVSKDERMNEKLPPATPKALVPSRVNVTNAPSPSATSTVKKKSSFDAF